MDYDVTVAISVDAAKKHTDKKDFDLILLDYEMPDIDGYNAYKYFLRNPLTMCTPIVFLTGVSDKERIQKIAALDPKPAGYLLKPIDSDRLKNVLKTVIKNTTTPKEGLL